MSKAKDIAEKDPPNDQAKLLLEIKKLQQDTSWQSRFATSLWPIVAAIFTGYLGLSTYYSQTNEKHMELLNQAFVNATDPKGDPAAEARRIAATWQLNQFWRAYDAQDERVIPPFLVAELAVKGAENQNLRCSAASVVGNLLSDDYLHSVGKRRFEDTRILLFGDKNGAIGQLSRLNVLEKLEQKGESVPAQECTDSLNVGPLDATREAIRMNWNYLRRANLAETDLNGVRLYEADLHFASLRNANLSGATFYCANLSGTDFTDSNLTDADFSYANITGATFPASFDIGIFPTLQMEDAEWREWRERLFASDDPLLKDKRLQRITLPASCDELNENFVKKRRAATGQPSAVSLDEQHKQMIQIPR